MKLALAQINLTIGNIAVNVNKIKVACTKAYALNSDLIVFSELTLTGYPPKDLLLEPTIINDISSAIDELKTFSQSIPNTAIVIGTPTLSKEKFGKPMQNSAIVISNGSIIHQHNKNLLPNYDVFDESRYFEPGFKSLCFTHKNQTIGITICEDAWSETNHKKRALYYRDPINSLVNKGATIILNLSASPYELGKSDQRDRLFKSLATNYDVPIVFINQVGCTEQLIFDGNSKVYLPDGTINLQLNQFSEDLQIWNYKTASNQDGSTQPEQLDLNELINAISFGINDYTKKTGFNHVVIGLSGGIDSALVAYLAKNACKNLNVTAISLPGPFSSKGSVIDAQSLCENLQIELIHHPITNSFDTLIQSFNPKIISGHIGLAQENLQARIRGTILMTYANELNALVLTTGNKSEIAVGYCTLYGDMNGALAPIGDLYKTDVYKLANFINSKEPIIPIEIINKPPSAELAPNQLDSHSLPEYSILDNILKSYLENHISPSTLEEQYPKQIIQKVIKLIKSSEHKRFQGAPILKVSKRSFGDSHRYVLV